jgi:hypothetical protein
LQTKIEKLEEEEASAISLSSYCRTGTKISISRYKDKKLKLILNNKLHVSRTAKQVKKSTKKMMVNALQQTFTDKQVVNLINPNQNKNSKWAQEDIPRAIARRSKSLRAYCFVRETMKLPLPSKQTIQ